MIRTINKCLELLLISATLILFGCSKDDFFTEPIEQEPLGEVLFNKGAHAFTYHINKTSNGFVVSGTGFLNLLEGAASEAYPLFVTLNDSLQTQQLKYPLTTSLSDIMSEGTFQVNEFYYTIINTSGYDHEMPAFIIKSDGQGNILWEKPLPNTNIIHSFSKLSNNSILIIGAMGRATVAPNYILKINTDGEIIFRKDYTINDKAHLHELISYESGVYTFLGYQLDADSRLSPKIIKTDETGSIIGEIMFDGFDDSAFYIRSTHIIKKREGGYIFTHSPGKFVNNVYREERYLKILNPNGDEIKRIDVNYACGYSVDYMEQVIQARDGSIYLLGSHNVSWGIGPWQICVLKFDSNGNYITSRKFDELDNRMGSGIIETSDGNLLILSNQCSLFKIDPSLNVL